MNDPYTLIASLGPINLWHRDKEGVDGACGWFMRANHGSATVLNAIISRYRFDWTHEVKTHNMGTTNTALFTKSKPSWPAMSYHAITLNLMFWAAYEHFGHNRKKAVKFMQDNLFDILLFAENPCDSAHMGFGHLYGYDERTTEDERIRTAAQMFYGWVLRVSRPWYKHPKWHVGHWRFTWG